MELDAREWRVNAKENHELMLRANEGATELRRERDEAQAALREGSDVLHMMLRGDWPIPRLAARLTRLQTIFDRALRTTPEQPEPQEER